MNQFFFFASSIVDFFSRVRIIWVGNLILHNLSSSLSPLPSSPPSFCNFRFYIKNEIKSKKKKKSWNCNKQLLIDRSTNGCEQQSPPSSSSSSLPLSSRQVNGIGPEKSAKNSYGMRSLDSIGNSSTIVIICPNCKRIQPLPSDIDYFTLFNLKGNLSSTSSPISSSYRYNEYDYDNKNGHKDQEESTDQKPHRFVESDESLGKDQHQQQPQREQNHSLQPFSLQYRIDLDQLRKEFIRLQQYSHPDMNINRSNVGINIEF